MIRKLAFLIPILVLSQMPVLAEAPAKTHVEPSDTSTEAGRQDAGEALENKVEREFSTKLNKVLDQAREAQLLVDEEDIRFATEKTSPTVDADEPVHTVRSVSFQCSDYNPLDFSDYEDMATYADITPYIQGVADVGVKRAKRESLLIAKAYLSLGMGAEARYYLRNVDADDSQALRSLANLIDGEGHQSTGLFLELANCHETNGIWLATAMLAAERPEGASLLGGYFADFRKLPFQLRATVASIAVPTLDRMNQRVLAQRVLADFTEEEISKASRLEFAQALLEMGHGSSSSNKKVQAFLNDPTYQADALSGLVRNGATLMPAQKDVLLDEMVKIFGKSGDDADVAIRLRFTLQELGRDSNYPLILELAALPALQQPSAQQEIRSQLANVIEHDLDSGDPLRAFSAIDVLLNEHGILDNLDRRSGLFEKAKEYADRAGYAELSSRLSQHAGQGASLAEQRAQIAFRRKDFDTVYGLATEYPASSKLAKLASLSAIQQADAKMLAKFEDSVGKTAADIIPLIEQDAIEGHWMVSPSIYDEAKRFSDPDAVRRVERVLALKTAWLSSVDAGNTSSIQSMPETLSRSSEAIANIRQKEAH